MSAILEPNIDLDINRPTDCWPQLKDKMMMVMMTTKAQHTCRPKPKEKLNEKPAKDENLEVVERECHLIVIVEDDYDDLSWLSWFIMIIMIMMIYHDYDDLSWLS